MNKKPSATAVIRNVVEMPWRQYPDLTFIVVTTPVEDE